MPIYEYICTACNHEFEKIQKFSDEPIRECEKCGGKVEKKISQSSFALKGTGWYITDYARKGEKKTDKKESDSTSEKKEAKEKKPDS